MQEQEYEITGGSLAYVIDEAGAPETMVEATSSQGQVRICGLHGLTSQVEIPEQIQGRRVTTVERKAFLSKKYLRRIQLPEGVRQLGDWAFAYCSALEEVELTGTTLQLGRAVFLECHNLTRILIPGKGEDVAALLAAAARQQVYYLLDVHETGSKDWFGQWDMWMTSVLRMADTEGYAKQVLCGEEDYGSTDLGAYISGRRMEKVRLALLRLGHAQELEPAFREELADYLRMHTKGCESEESWQVIRDECSERRADYRLFAALGCVTTENIDAILQDIEESHPEMKAFFLRYKEEMIGPSDFFGDLEL